VFRLSGGLKSLGKVYPGWGFSLDIDDYQITTPNADRVSWGDVYAGNFSLPLRIQANERWTVFLAPSVGFNLEQGADFSDSLRGGLVLSAGYAWDRDRVVGVGAGAFYGLEDTSVFPALLVRWRFGERWFVGNPFRISPAGPAGLEVAYHPGRRWELGLGGGYRTNRFRLDKNAVSPNGIGEVQGLPIYARVSRRLGKTWRVDAYAGAIFDGEIKLDDQGGNYVAASDYDTQPVLGIILNRIPKWEQR
jgi:hypothetical protein